MKTQKLIQVKQLTNGCAFTCIAAVQLQYGCYFHASAAAKLQ